ncbi:bifunctional diguanylate cyclase/phosphodiesterase [Mycobacterium sp. NAZ190054]|uniref:putative bifunctional diguanylate cyclase/phosphodiesterase n=1 Tax=Mycobacterium sp. NAZ190054 TaxID=1747766 RepID=UPI000796EB98|nr:bifunctional diguanylate cyclase/phosphodiesterase [Mycobacterium sp. NAZ190054]KWX57751.1 diguanylate phosphodiesterase [Mycobacterium sp. NAZ190054]
MAPHVRRPRLVLTAAVSVVAVLNAVALFGDEVARRGEAVLQVSTGIGAAVCGLVVARRVTGPARWWRLLYVGALLTWVVGQVLWTAGGLQAAPLVGRVSYLLMPTLALASLALLLRSSGRLTRHREVSPRQQPVITNVLDGIVAGLSFLVLAALGGFGTTSMEPTSGSQVPTFGVVFAVAELVVVAAVVVITMVYEPARPHRTAFLLLAAGLLMMASSDRLVAYFRVVGVPAGELWVGIGLIVGPVLIGFAMLEHQPKPGQDRSRDLDWAQLILPYLGFVGVTILLAYHFWLGRQVTPPISAMIITIVLLIAVRQVLATRAQNLLTRRLYWAQRGLAHQVHHDALTGLPNRILFAQRLDEAMTHGRFVLIFVDIDDFKEVNDRFGHAAGDELLCAVGERLKRCVSDGDTLARIGGDEFAILILGEVEQLEVVAERLRIALRDPFPVHGSSVRVRASMGLVRPESDGVPQTSDDLLRQADISMYAGKRMGKDTAVVYQPSSGVTVDFPTMLRNAEGGVPPGFRLVYQPVVRLPQGTPVALEALARWTAPNGIDISPETFVVVAEANGLGARLDALVLDLACREVRGMGLDLDIHVNIGAARLGNPGFEQQVREVLTRYRIPHDRLVLEITETEPIVDLDRAAAQIGRLSELGVKVALDDFGAGFNSLTYLHCLPVHIVKLDRSLLSGGEPARNLALYRSVFRLCDDLGLEVIAEGIESAAQSDLVYRAGGTLAQGHLFSRPMGMPDLVETFADGYDREFSPIALRDLTQAD